MGHESFCHFVQNIVQLSQRTSRAIDHRASCIWSQLTKTGCGAAISNFAWRREAGVGVIDSSQSTRPNNKPPLQFVRRARAVFLGRAASGRTAPPGGLSTVRLVRNPHFELSSLRFERAVFTQGRERRKGDRKEVSQTVDSAASQSFQSRTPWFGITHLERSLFVPSLRPLGCRFQF